MSASWSRATPPKAACTQSSNSDRFRPLILGGIIFILAILTSLVHLAGLSAMAHPDTSGYLITFKNLFSRHSDDLNLRTPLYPFLLAASSALLHSGLGVIWSQFVCRALACAITAYVLGGHSLIAATLVGSLLALDTPSATNSVTYLTESLFTSGQVLTFALVVHHAWNPCNLRGRHLFAVGAIFGLSLMIRPTGWIFLPPLVLAYAWLLRSIRKSLLMAAGFLSVILAIVLFNGIRSNHYVVARNGLYLAFPLFIHHLFSPENGPASQTIESVLEECHPGLNLERLTVENADSYVHGKIAPCLTEHLGGNTAAAWAMLRDAHKEALRARPIEFARQTFEEILIFLYSPPAYHTLQNADFHLLPKTETFCDAAGASGGSALQRFVCPLPRPSPQVRRALIAFSLGTRLIYQPYAPLMRLAPRSLPLAVLVLFGFWILAFAASSHALRVPIALAATFIVLNATVTAVGAVTIPRYTSVAAPFHLIIAGLALYSIVARGAAALGERFRSNSDT